MIGVLLMAYGSPNSLDEVRPYLEDIRSGRPVSDAAVAELTERYRHVGCPSPLLEVTRAQGELLQAALGDDVKVFVGMKHWSPWIRDAVAAIVAEGIDHVVGIAAAPHNSGISIGGYEQRILRAREELGATFSFEMVRSWHAQPAFIELVARNLRVTLDELSEGPEPLVLFTAHSLPARILEAGDPYRDELLTSATTIAQAARVRRWEFAFQSESQTGEPWLGPDINERLEGCAREGIDRIVVAPIGFVCDHLEIRYDLDLESKAVAERLGIELRRIPSPNAAPELADAMAGAVRATLGAAESRRA